MNCRKPDPRLFPPFRAPVRPSQRGIALVITLILLSVITFMAITFLILSQRERESVNTQTEHAIARLAADSATERAKTELLARMLVFNSDQLYSRIVSTNYINPWGYDPTAPAQPAGFNPTNVNYEYIMGTFPPQPLNANQQLQNLANLLWDPRPPVFITNRLAPFGKDFRFYIDENRNGRFEGSGLRPVVGADPVVVGFPVNTNIWYYDNNGNIIANIVPGNTLSNHFCGEPEWIGVLEFPERPHSASNWFTARYAFEVIAASRALDINAIHNYSRLLVPDMNQTTPGDGFLRNQGVGAYEINLGAFFTDLNTNVWLQAANPYTYNLNLGQGNQGAGFDDALTILRYRYGDSYANLAGLPLDVFPHIDLFANGANGALMTGVRLAGDFDDDDSLSGFPGADNPIHIFNLQELYDRNRMRSPQVVSFVDRLLAAGTGFSSYDSYTFQRLKEQLGTDSAPEYKLNVNFKNVDAGGNIVPGMQAAGIRWTNAMEFFTNAATRLLRVTFGNDFITTNGIQVYPTNQYTPSVHRLLQLTANIYDSTTNHVVPGTGYPHLPTVIRPYFRRIGSGADTRVFIAGFGEVTDTSLLDTPPVEMVNVPLVGEPFAVDEAMPFGMPLIVGAKKGFPNFNEFTMQNLIQVIRKLEFRRPSSTEEVNETNQMYVIRMASSFGMEAWNSYITNFPRSLRIRAVGQVKVAISNELDQLVYVNNLALPATNYVVPSWPGTGSADPTKLPSLMSFQIPISNSVMFLTNSTWRPNNSPVSSQLVPLSGVFDRPSRFPVPNWRVTLGARVRFFLVDENNNRIVDYVNLSRDEEPVDIMGKLISEGNDCGPNALDNTGNGNQWCTNRPGNSVDIRVPTYGVLNQIMASWRGVDGGHTTDIPREELPRASQTFREQFIGGTNLVFYSPVNPADVLSVEIRWQANDPLVHYMIGDLVDLNPITNIVTHFQIPPLANLGVVNSRYEPWGGRPGGGSGSPTLVELAVKDPLVRRSDDWDFPTNVLPNIGWLGRVHRGTPWQTVYLKAREFGDTNLWVKWTGNNYLLRNWDGQNQTMIDALVSRPTRDRDIFEVFGASFSDNASRGQLSINQDGLAAWSAVLSGVLVLTNITPAPSQTTPALFDAVPIQPAGIFNAAGPRLPQVAQIVAGINRTRTNSAAFPNRVFNRLGDILAVPELSIGNLGTPTNSAYVGVYPNGYWTNASPFLNLGNPAFTYENTGVPWVQAWGISEAAYERIPQQILSLLTLSHTPRFVIYSYGQTLRPAEGRSVMSSGPFQGMCTNYQVTAEIAMRTVVRVEGSTDPRDFQNPDPLRRYPPRLVTEQFNILPPD